MLRHWSQFVPNMSTDIRGHEALLHHQSITELKVAITQKIRAIRMEECVRVIDDFTRRLQVCLRQSFGLCALINVRIRFRIFTVPAEVYKEICLTVHSRK